MSYEIRADYSERWLFPPALEEWVPADHPARLVRDLVDAMDLAALGFAPRTAVDGRPNYAADLLLKVWLYGYMNGIRKLRKLEKACREHLSLVWLTGRHYPDHNTLWRFFRDNREPLRAVYKRVLKFAVTGGLVEVVLHAVDGTKILAQGSKDALRTKEKLGEVLAQLDEAVEEVMQEMETAAAEEAETESYQLPESWRDEVVRREEVRELLLQLETDERETLHPREREARLMKTRSQGIALAYNAQSVVDSGSGLIVAAAVTQEETDYRQLVSMLDQVKENVGQVAEETAGDGGYCSGAELAKAAERGYEVIVNEKLPGAGKPEGAFHVSRFRYDAATDCWTCPQGQPLTYERRKNHGVSKGKANGEEVRLYRCRACGTCPVRPQCTDDKQGRTVGLSRFYPAMQAQREKRALPEKRALLKRRREIVEAPFGFIKEVLGFRRFGVGGLDGVRTQWALVCTAFNLLKLYPLWRTGALVLNQV